MASQYLFFKEPDIEGLTTLYVEESADGLDPFVEIDHTDDIGTYPDYITSFTTDQAADPTHFFRIRWGNGDGYFTEYSLPMQGRSNTVIGQIVKRVIERDFDFGFDVSVIAQEAEVAISTKFGADTDPYDPTLTVTAKEMAGLVYLTIARAYAFQIMKEGSEGNYTAGLVSQRSDTGKTRMDQVDWFVREANKLLGLNVSAVMLLEDCDPIGIGVTSAIDYDQSRLTVFFE